MPEVFDENTVVIEFSDLYQAGQLQFEKGLQEHPQLRRIWQDYRSQLLLVMLTLEDEDGELERVQQTGVFVSDGQYILTAAHGFLLEDCQLIDLKARTVSGVELPLDVVRLYYDKEGWKVDDWAILRPSVFTTPEGVFPENKKSGGGPVLIMGFPGGLGLNEQGIVERANELGLETVMPLGIICDRILMKPQTLRPIAGAIPIRGISGAPVLDQNGGLIGLFSSVSRTNSSGGWGYIFGMSDIPWKTLDSLSKN
ncbi:MAG: serine protease [Candidatus Marinimicrobia bacterium]|nr:serine protease [Candidatus Neomarinimicrobiota bacterium]MCF7921283.1 serine protease [Candidatus Neomarinimicrobiota bacterium]